MLYAVRREELSAVCCLYMCLFVVYCLLSVVCWLSVAVEFECRLSSVVRCLLRCALRFVFCGLRFVVCCSLFVARCVLLVVCC